MAEEKDETINKLITALAQQSSLLGLGSEKHGEEAIELKKEWFRTVASSLEKTNISVDKAHMAIGDLQKVLHLHQLDVKTDMSKLKDFVNSELKDIKEYHDTDLEKFSEKLEYKLNKITEKLEQIPIVVANLKDDLKDGLANLKADTARDSSSFKDKLMSDEIKPLDNRVTNIYIKVMVLSTVASIVASAILSIILAYVKG
jgi:phage-related minor tail protein